MTRNALHGSILAGLLVAAVASAHPAATPAKGPPRVETVTMNGEIIDPQCYFTHESRGVEHAACAAKCAKGGQGLSFLDDRSGIVYPLIAKTHGANQNEGLVTFIGQPVQVKGVVYRKGSNSVLLVQSVTMIPAKAK